MYNKGATLNGEKKTVNMISTEIESKPNNNKKIWLEAQELTFSLHKL